MARGCCRSRKHGHPVVKCAVGLLLAGIIAFGVILAAVPSIREKILNQSGSSSSSLPFFTSGGGTSVPFYADPTYVVFWYPLLSNYTDVTGQTTAQLFQPAGSLCQPSFASITLPNSVVSTAWRDPCDTAMQGIAISGAAMPQTYSWSTFVQFANGAGNNNIVMILSGNHSTGVSYYMQADLRAGVNQLTFVHGGNAYVAKSPSSPTLFAVGAQTHIVVTYNDTTRVGSLYLNGQYVNNVNSITSPSWTSTSTKAQPLIGSYDEGDFTFVGLQRNVRCFNIELTDTQVQQLYTVDTSS